MLNAIVSARSILVAIFMLMAGGGFMGALVGIRLQDSGRDAVWIGLVATAYFGGLTLGSLRVGRIIDRVGHIRAFAAFVALLSASTLAYSAHQNIALWGVLRFIDGLCLAGVYVCLESWLGDRSDPAQRGSSLAAYMIALYAGQAVGQFLLTLGQASPSLPFVAASILISLSIIPIALTRSPSPVIEPAPAMSIRRLYAISPLGFVGAGVTGVLLGAFYGLGAVYARQQGLGLGATAAFMSAVIAGGVALQWPLGWLSDRFDRRRVIVGAFAGATLVAVLIAVLNTQGLALSAMGALFGGLSFALYPLCVAHANDHITPDQRVGASGGLVLVYSAGAACGPLVGAMFMTILGPVGLFTFIAVSSGGAVAFALWRFSARASVPSELQQPYQVRPRTTPMSATLDPLAPEPASSFYEAMHPPIVTQLNKDEP
ncbi:MAG: MFS transporter [Phenylobacterium sp.]|nr:MFS transporter [Phenylobacterium sp.]